MEENTFLSSVKKAKNMVFDATKNGSFDKYAIKDGHLKNALGKTMFSAKTIIIDTQACKKYHFDIVPTIVHELLHALSFEDYPLLIAGESDFLRDAILVMDETPAKKAAIRLYRFLVEDGKCSKYDAFIAEKLLTKGDKILSDLENKLIPVRSLQRTKLFIKVYDSLYDKIENTLRHNACGGHTDEWFDLKEKVEDMFGIEIPVEC